MVKFLLQPQFPMFEILNVTGWTIEVLGFDSRWGLGIFLFTTASRMALRPTKPPIQWVPGALSLGVKRLRCEADHSPSSITEVKKWVELYLHSPITPPWRGAQLKHRDNFTLLYLKLPFHHSPNTTSSSGTFLRHSVLCAPTFAPRLMVTLQVSRS
jgi:hypothetical protein